MLARNGAGPASAETDSEAGIDLGAGKRPLSSRPQANVQAIRAEIDADICTSAGIAGRGTTPVLALCRQLLAAGLNPDQAMEVYRGATLALRIRSIGEAAGLEINSKGTGFVPARAVRTASPMRKKREAPLGVALDLTAGEP